MKVQYKFNHFELSRMLTFVNQGLSQKQIGEKLNLKPSTLSMRLKRLIEQRYIQEIPKTKPRFFELLPLGKQILENKFNDSSVGERTIELSPKIRMHNLRVKIPIISDLSEDFWENTLLLRNWEKRSHKLKGVGLNLERTTKSIIILFSPLNLREKAIFGAIWSGVTYAIGYLKENGVEVDPRRAETITQEYSVAEPLAKPLTDKGIVYRHELGRPQERIFSEKPKPAYAQIDASQGRPEIDSNDLQYARNLLAMPENMVALRKDITNVATALTGLWDLQEAYHKNLDLHMKVMQDIRVMVRKMNSNLDQRRLGDFLRGAP